MSFGFGLQVQGGGVWPEGSVLIHKNEFLEFQEFLDYKFSLLLWLGFGLAWGGGGLGLVGGGGDGGIGFKSNSGFWVWAFVFGSLALNPKPKQALACFRCARTWSLSSRLRPAHFVCSTLRQRSCEPCSELRSGCGLPLKTSKSCILETLPKVCCVMNVSGTNSNSCEPAQKNKVTKTAPPQLTHSKPCTYRKIQCFMHAT